jgi:hypothetical protein
VEHQDADAFNRLALEIFALHYRHLPLYRRYCERRGATPADISSWEEIPPLPTDCFKVAALTLLPEHTVRTFMTSGTTRSEERGKVLYDAGGLKIMDATIEEAATAFLFLDGVKNTILIIAPSPEMAPHMVMAYGMNHLKEHFGQRSRGILLPSVVAPSALSTSLTTAVRRDCSSTFLRGPDASMPADLRGKAERWAGMSS